MAKNFSDSLKKRIAPPKPIVIAWKDIPLGLKKHADVWEAERKRIAHTQREKLDLLAEHYGIPKGVKRDTQLALRLAQEFVPGFKFGQKRGAPKKWPDDIRGALVVVIDALRKPGVKGMGPTYVAKQLAKCEPWCRMVQGLQDPAGALLNVYKNTKKNEGCLVSRVQRVKEHHAESETGLSAFDQVVARWINEAIKSR